MTFKNDHLPTAADGHGQGRTSAAIDPTCQKSFRVLSILDAFICHQNPFGGITIRQSVVIVDFFIFFLSSFPRPNWFCCSVVSCPVAPPSSFQTEVRFAASFCHAFAFLILEISINSQTKRTKPSKSHLAVKALVLLPCPVRGPHISWDNCASPLNIYIYTHKRIYIYMIYVYLCVYVLCVCVHLYVYLFIDWFLPLFMCLSIGIMIHWTIAYVPPSGHLWAFGTQYSDISGWNEAIWGWFSSGFHHYSDVAVRPLEFLQ